MTIHTDAPRERGAGSMWREDIPLSTSPLRFVLFSSKPYWTWMVFSLLAVSIAAGLNAGSSYAYKLIVNAAIDFSTKGIAGLWYAAAFYIVITTLASLMWRVSGFVGMRWVTGVRATARYALSAYALRHGYQYFSDRFAGSISSKIGTASNSAKEISEQMLWQFTGFTVTMITSFFIIYSSSVSIAYIFLGWVVIIAPLNIYFARRRVPISAATQKMETELTGTSVDMLTNISAVHELTGRIFELSRLKRLIVRRRLTGMRNWRYGEWVLLLNSVLQDIFVAGMILLSVYYVSKGVLSPGDIVLVLTVVLIAEDRLTFIGNQINNFGEAWGQIVEGLDDILKPHEVVDSQRAAPLALKEASVELDSVSFTYGGEHIFDNLSLHIPAGQRVGLVGRSGAGKSTLMKILLRHYNLSSGSIRIGEQDIAETTLESLRKAIGVVPQEPLLFHRSIRENIAYGNPEASESAVIAAAKAAQAHEFIDALPEKYEALVGERGVKLSGGQRQRIAIARAILKDAPILLLDEATSALDSESEVAVQKALLKAMEGRTVVAIAHRLSTLRAMDRIIVMDKGKIIEDGSHDELLASGGLYSELWTHQAGGFLED